MHKSETVLKTGQEYNWDGYVIPVVPDSLIPEEYKWNLTLIRGYETLQVQWVGNKLVDAFYKYGDYYSLVLNWRNQIIKIIKDTPDPKKLKGTTVERIQQTRSVPWTHETMDDEIVDSVLDCTITWIRKFDSELLSAKIFRSRHVKVTAPVSNPDNRVLEWADPYGFHAVHLDSIIRVE